MRRIVLFSSLLVLGSVVASRDAFAKLDGPAWDALQKRFTAAFQKPGDADGKKAAVEEAVADGEPRAWAMLAGGLVQQAIHVGMTGERLTKDLNDLQPLLAKTYKQLDAATQKEMFRLEDEVSDLEKTKSQDDSVLEAMVLAFSGATEDGRRQFLTVAKGHKEWMVRSVGARVAATAPDEEASKAMLADALSANQDGRVKCTALEGLEKAPGKSAGWHDLVIARLEDPDWSVQVVAAKLAGAREMGKAIPTLVKVLGKCPPRVSEEVVGALRKLTGQNFEATPEPWAKWWEAHRADFGADGKPLQPVVARPTPKDIDYYGIKVRSDKVMFIIDISGSMKDEKQAPPEPPKPKGPVTGEGKPPPEAPKKFFGPKIEIAKKELTRTLKALPKEAMFDVIAFNHTVRQWQPKMMQATDKNKDDAIAWFKDEPPSGSTYIDGALEMAFKMAGMGAYDKAYTAVTVDTIFLLSDGAPTDNKEPSKDMDPKEILDHVREWNKQRRVVINCVGIDNVVQGITFMKALAAQNGGTYVDG